MPENKLTTKDQNEIQDQINSTLWKACDTFRGVVDASDYKNYLLVFLFVKYLSDVRKEHYEDYKKLFGDDEERIKRKMNRERFKLSENCTFEYFVKNKKDEKIGSIINKALEKIEEDNKEKLEGVFRNIDFNSESNLGEVKDRNRRLEHLINDFDNPILDFSPSVIGTVDIIGNAYMFLIEKFASGAGKKGGEFYTPTGVCSLLAKILNPNSNSRICDPTIGSGSLAIKVGEEIEDKNFRIYGQESNGSTWALAKMNMFLHNLDSAKIEWGNTITNPKLIENDSLMKFDVVVANPPFSLDKWGIETAQADKYKRFERGIPPASKGDFAFISHMVETAKEGTGKVGVILPHGVLFRGSSEGKIRRKFLEENLIEAVVGLPEKLFFGTGIPAAILIFNKAKTTTDVLFIDGSKEFEAGKRQNELKENHIEKIAQTFKNFETVPKFSYRATFEEIQENDFNLNIPRYVDTFEEEEEIDILEVQKEIDKLENELLSVKSEMNKILKEIL